MLGAPGSVNCRTCARCRCESLGNWVAMRGMSWLSSTIHDLSMPSMPASRTRRSAMRVAVAGAISPLTAPSTIWRRLKFITASMSRSQSPG